MNYDSIKITYEDTELGTRVHGDIRIHAAGELDRSYRGNEGMRIVKEEIRHLIHSKIYGQVQADARKALHDILFLLQKSPYIDLQTLDKIQNAMNPLVNAGNELLNER